MPREVLTRALSIRQPLVEMILRGEKKFEFRSKLTHIRERVYLYAGKKPASVEGFPAGEAKLLPRGLILGSIEIIDCLADENGDLDGDFAWELASPIRYAEPLMPRGVPQPGFWHPKF
jgi:hypothetical protein